MLYKVKLQSKASLNSASTGQAGFTRKHYCA